MQTKEILETIKMIDEEYLDIRTTTMGISLLDRMDTDIDKSCEKIKKKICSKAKDLVKVGNEFGKEYGIPVVNKRISVTPISMLVAVSGGDPVKYALTLEECAQELGVDFIGGFSALVQKGYASGDKELIEAIPEALAKIQHVCASVNVGVSGPGVVRAVLAKADKNLPMDKIADLIKRTAFKITRMGQLVGTVASEKLGVPFGIVDLSLAPTPAIGDSVAYILEEMGLETCGAYGTTACLAMLNDAVKKGGVMATSNVGGLSGAFIPVSEDAGMIHAAKAGVLSLEKLEAMTAVCSVGLDMIVVPGDTSASVISGVIADEAAIGMVNSKTTAVRIIPAIGKEVGEELDFGGLLGSGPVMPIRQTQNDVMINRGGRIRMADGIKVVPRVNRPLR